LLVWTDPFDAGFYGNRLEKLIWKAIVGCVVLILHHSLNAITMISLPPSILFTSLLLGSAVCEATTYISVNSDVASSSLTDDILAGISPTGTATREGGDGAPTISLDSLTDGVTATVGSGRSFVNAGTLDYDLGGIFDISTIYFRLVNAVVDDRLSFTVTVSVSTDYGSSYSEVASVSDAFDNSGGDYATTGTLSGINANSVTNLRFLMGNLGTYSASFSEIDVTGMAVPEPSGAVLTTISAMGLLLRRRNRRVSAH
jgi:hypothetical protein